MNLVTKKLKSLRPCPWNPRETLKPEDHEYQAIKSSLTEFGLVQPLVWNKTSGYLVGGHQRRQVMIDEGIEQAQVVVVELDEQQEKKLNIQLNRISGRWDAPRLEQMLAEMKGSGIDLQNLGFSPVELKELLNRAKPKPIRDPDAPAPPLTVAISKAGDIYELQAGEQGDTHRLMCGDSTRADHLTELMNREKARIVFTDPPFGVSYTAGDNARDGTEKYQGAILNDDLRGTKLQEFLSKVFSGMERHTIDRASFYCFYASCNHIEFESAMNNAGWRVKQQLIWSKQMVLSRSDYHYSHEPFLYCAKHGQNSDWLGDRTETTVIGDDAQAIDKLSKEDLVRILKAMHEEASLWAEKRDAANTYIHPCQKPTSLSRRALRNSSLPSDIVLDPFLGSGSTLIGAELEGRRCHGLELDPCYLDAAVKRFHETFENVKIQRNGKNFEP